MKTYITILCFTSFLSATLAQSTCKLSYEKGDKIVTTYRSYQQDFEYSEKFMKMKADKKQKVVDEFNSKVLSGTIGGYVFPTDISVSEVYNADGAQEVVMTFKMGDETATNTYLYANDTLYIKQMDGFKALGETGVTVFGVEKIPCHIKIGNQLPPYMNYTISFPQTHDTKLHIMAISEYTKHNRVGFGEFKDSRTGSYGYGMYSYEEEIPNYALKEVEGKMEVSYQQVTIYNQLSAVTDTTELTIDGKKYTAFVIESENWTKPETKVKFFSEYQEAVDRANKGQERMDNLVAKRMEKSGITNEFGYIPTHTIKYYIPEFGVVKTITYGMFGIIQSITELTDISK